MNNLFFLLLPFLINDSMTQNHQCYLCCDDEGENAEKYETELAEAEEIEEDTPEEKDEFEFYPLGYLPEMYYVQVDCQADTDDSTDAFEKRRAARRVTETCLNDFKSAEKAITRLLTIKGVDRNLMRNAVKDYCDHLCDLIDSGKLD